MKKDNLIYSTVQILTNSGEGTGFIMDLTNETRHIKLNGGEK